MTTKLQLINIIIIIIIIIIVVSPCNVHDDTEWTELPKVPFLYTLYKGTIDCHQQYL